MGMLVAKPIISTTSELLAHAEAPSIRCIQWSELGHHVWLELRHECTCCRVAPGPAPVLAQEVQPTRLHMPVLPDGAQASEQRQAVPVTTAPQPAAAVTACSVPQQQQQQQLSAAVKTAGVQQMDQQQQRRQQKQGPAEALAERPSTW